jgi:4-carboxymuconolactone decarboxylase
MTEEEIIAEGKKVFEKCYNGVVPLPQQLPAKSFGELNMKLFREIWGDDTLSFREKRLVVMGILAGRNADPSLFTIHARSALRNRELNAAELRAIMPLFLMYSGAPSASTMFMAAEKLLAETKEGETA